MKFTPNSTARRKTAMAAFLSFGGPQIPSPVMRMAPKPRRLTVSSPPSVMVPAAPAGEIGVVIEISPLRRILRFEILDSTPRTDDAAETARIQEACGLGWT